MYKNTSESLPGLAKIKSEPREEGEGGSPSPPLAGPHRPPGPGLGVWPFNPALLQANRLLLFCDIVLTHVNYPHAFRDQTPPPRKLKPEREEAGDSSESSGDSDNKSNIVLKNDRAAESPLNSVGESARESIRLSTSSSESLTTELDQEDGTGIEKQQYDKETFDSVSCWCGKPFAGRPMIECDDCLIWYHMKCENVRQSSIPENFHCSRCRGKKKRRKRPASSSFSRKPTKRANLDRKSRKSDSALISTPAATATSEATSRLSEPVPAPSTSRKSQSSKESNNRSSSDKSSETKVNGTTPTATSTSSSSSTSSIEDAKVTSNSVPVSKKKGKSSSSSSKKHPPNDKKKSSSKSSKVTTPPPTIVKPLEKSSSGSSHKKEAVDSKLTVDHNSMPPKLPCYKPASSKGKDKKRKTPSPSATITSAEADASSLYEPDASPSTSLASLPRLKPEVETVPQGNITITLQGQSQQRKRRDSKSSSASRLSSVESTGAPIQAPNRPVVSDRVNGYGIH